MPEWVPSVLSMIAVAVVGAMYGLVMMTRRQQRDIALDVRSLQTLVEEKDGNPPLMLRGYVTRSEADDRNAIMMKDIRERFDKLYKRLDDGFEHVDKQLDSIAPRARIDGGHHE